MIKKVKLDTPVTNQMTSHPYCINFKSVLSQQQSGCLNELGNIMKFCTNKNNDSDIKEIIDSQVKVCWEEWSEHTNTLIDALFIFDFLFYNPNRESMSETDLEQKRPEWKDCILPRMKSSDFVFLFTSEWYEVMYDKRTKAFEFVPCNRPPELSEDTNMFAATMGLAYPMRIALVSLVRPIRTMQQITEDLEQKVRIPFEMTVRATHQGVCHELYKLVCKMAKEVDLWQERFDLLLDTTLCEDCIEEKDGLYQSDDYKAARDWNPGKECNLGGCSYSSTAWDTCNLYKKQDDAFDTVN